VISELFGEFRVQYSNHRLSIEDCQQESTATWREKMPAQKRTVKGKKAEPIKRKAAPAKSPVGKKKAAPPKSLAPIKQAEKPKTSAVELIRQTLTYYYLLSFCPPARIADFQTATGLIHKGLAASSGMKEADFFSAVIPEVSRRIVAFHQDTREPDRTMVASLAKAATAAEKDAAGLAAFQNQMKQIAALPGRAKKESRLHRDKGCDLCAAPCRYGYFSLITEPNFSLLQTVMAVEAAKPAAEQSPLGMAYGFAGAHIAQIAGPRTNWIDTADLANLSFCLLLLSIAKSRLAAPEEHIRLFQDANQEFIRRSQMGELPVARNGNRLSFQISKEK
jgi:hypothetical protein